MFGHIFICNQKSLQSGGGSDCGNRISGADFLTVFHSNYRSYLLSF